MRGIEERYIHNMEQPSDQEIERLGLLADELIVDTINSNLEEFRARLSTMAEDSGVKDIGEKQTIDVVMYHKDKPVIGMQVTTSEDPKIREKKMQDLIDHPFIHLSEMKPTDKAIPKALVYLRREIVQAFDANPEVKNNSEVMLAVLDGAIKSLTFDTAKTKNPLEIKALQDLIKLLTNKQRNLSH